MKEALFGILGGRVAGAHAIDLYAGTGALGIEALSRGAERATWVERESALVRLIRRNLMELGIEEPSRAARVVQGHVAPFLRRLNPESRLVLLADPPYDVGAPDLLRWIEAHPDGYAAAVLEHSLLETPGQELAEAARLDRRAYGNVGITVFTPL